MKIEVNDGFVELIDHMGDDLAIVNAARVSYAGESKEWTGKDEKLLRYLWDHNHSSPFRHGNLKFRIKAPIFVLRQWMKHQVGCAWNEQSARYTEIKESFFYPEHFRLQDTKNKQSSFGYLDDDADMDIVPDSLYDSLLDLLDSTTPSSKKFSRRHIKNGKSMSKKNVGKKTKRNRKL